MREVIRMTVQDDDTVDIDTGDNILINDDYRRLKNLPMLDGRPIVDNIQEQDPTVPAWAKQPDKPKYTASEIGMVELDAGDFEEMWESIGG